MTFKVGDRVVAEAIYIFAAGALHPERRAAGTPS